MTHQVFLVDLYKTGHGVHEFTISHLIKKNDAKRQIIPNASKQRFQYGDFPTYEPLATKWATWATFEVAQVARINY